MIDVGSASAGCIGSSTVCMMDSLCCVLGFVVIRWLIVWKGGVVAVL